MVNQLALLPQLQSARSPTANPRQLAASLRSPTDKSKLQLAFQSLRSLTARSKPPLLLSLRSRTARSKPPALLRTHALRSSTASRNAQAPPPHPHQTHARRSSTVSHNAQAALDGPHRPTVLTPPLLRPPHPLHLRPVPVSPSTLATTHSASSLVSSLSPCYKRTTTRIQLHSLRRRFQSGTRRSLTRFLPLGGDGNDTCICNDSMYI